jgi:hypothetical protein
LAGLNSLGLGGPQLLKRIVDYVVEWLLCKADRFQQGCVPKDSASAPVYTQNFWWVYYGTTGRAD